jgi:hypothetical protein
MMDLGGYQLRIPESGSGTLALIFEFVLGEEVATWNDVQPQVAVLARPSPMIAPRQFLIIPAILLPLGRRRADTEPRELAEVTHEAGLIFTCCSADHVQPGVPSNLISRRTVGRKGCGHQCHARHGLVGRFV